MAGDHTDVNPPENGVKTHRSTESATGDDNSSLTPC